MKFVLDTNEFLFLLKKDIKYPPQEKLFNVLLNSFPKHSLHIPRLIIDEVKRNLTPQMFKEFLYIIQPIARIDENIIVPFEIAERYTRMGLKAADAFIAAYTESVGSDFLISENRHFLSRKPDLPFRVVNAETILKLLPK